MAILPFNDLYISSCEQCGADLEAWMWLEDDMQFHTACTCGTEYTLEPTTGVLNSDTTLSEDLEDDE